MLTVTDAQLPWVIGIGSFTASIAAMFAVLAVEDLRARVRRRRKGRAIVDRVMAEQPPRLDPVEQHFADAVGIAVHVEPAPATDELPPVDEADVNGLLVEIYRAQTRARFRNIYGEEGQP